MTPTKFLASYEGSAQHRQDLADCRASLVQGSKSFLAASRLLPAQVRDPACALYAFCRVADDDIDLSPSEAAQWQKLAQLQARLDRVYRGEALQNQVDRSFAWVVHRFDIPEAVPRALLEGFEWDLQKRRYETMSDLHDYAARVAGSVGVMMALIMGVREAKALARASDLGTAMQLSNIARDVGEDARNQRLYLPLDALRRQGLNIDAWMKAPQMLPLLKPVLQDLLAEAQRLYQRAELGIAQLPAAARPGISMARWFYAEIGEQVVRNGYDSVSQRAVVSGKRKIGLSVVALLSCLQHSLAPSLLKRSREGRDFANAPALSANQFLVDAVRAIKAAPHSSQQIGLLATTARSGQVRDQEGSIPWVLDLLLQLEARR